MTITVRAPAKINLFLHVTGKRSDGYHDLFTLFQMVGLYDEITVEEQEDIQVICDIGGLKAEENIAFLAAALLRREHAVTRGARITITKGIPAAAGLGGGSSDAAATLMALNRLWSLGLDKEDLMRLGAELGADVPFFFQGPAALGRGRGDILEPFAPMEGWVLLVNPGFMVSTAWVFKNIFKLTTLPDNTKLPSFLRKGASVPLIDISDLNDCLHNSLEEVTIRHYPEIEDLKNCLLDCGAAAALMSGSGPTVFGLFSSEADAASAAGKLASKDRITFVAPTLTRFHLTL